MQKHFIAKSIPHRPLPPALMPLFAPSSPPGPQQSSEHIIRKYSPTSVALTLPSPPGISWLPATQQRIFSYSLTKHISFSFYHPATHPNETSHPLSAQNPTIFPTRAIAHSPTTCLPEYCLYHIPTISTLLYRPAILPDQPVPIPYHLPLTPTYHSTLPSSALFASSPRNLTTLRRPTNLSRPCLLHT
jgi:hypothetical protein